MLNQKGLFRNAMGKDDEMPFINQKRKCLVRVVDYYPPNIVDFASLGPVQKGDSQSDDEMDVDSSSWIWNFFLLVEDGETPTKAARNRVSHSQWVHVSNANAQYLLNLDPVE